MAVAVQHPDLTLAELADGFDVPEGYRVEIIGGQIVVSPTPVGRHQRVVSNLFRAFHTICPEGLEAFDFVTIALPGTEERYIPDFVVLPEAVVVDDEWIFSVSELILAVEITSAGNAGNDRVRKLRGCAAASMPLYLLIDLQKEQVTLFEDPKGGVYHRHTQVDIGGKITLPEPFSAALDTAPFAARKRE